MKRILFVGLIALLVLLAVPAVMAADSDAATVTGTLANPITISVDVATDSLAFTTMPINGLSDVVQTSVTATLTGPGTSWGVSASTDAGFIKGDGKAHMYSDGSAKWLTTPIEVTSTIWDSSYYLPHSFMSGTTNDAVTKTAYFRQNVIEDTDFSGAYRITVDFAGIAS